MTVTNHTGGLTRVAFSPDGKQLITAGDDGTVRVYALAIEDLLALARARVSRSLNIEECQRFLHTDTCPSD